MSDFPMRINKYLALKKLCSRREADFLIEAGKVLINGRMAVLGDKIMENDEVIIEKRSQSKLEHGRVYLAYYKPKNIVTHSPEEGQKAIRDIINFSGRLFPLGRLDRDSHGLIILTNDGRITDRLLNPKYVHEKEYEVEVDKNFDERFLDKMASGVKIDENYLTKKAKVLKVTNKKFSITLIEGKKRQIRKMCEALDYKVIDLKRVRVMNVKVGNLRPGQYRKLQGEELRKFLMNLGIVK